MSPYTSNYNRNFINFTNRGKILNTPPPRYIGDLDLLLFFLPSKNIYSNFWAMHVYDMQQMADFLYVRYETPHSSHTHLVLRRGGGGDVCLT